MLRSIRLICVNRPGAAKTSQAVRAGGKANLSTACDDARVVLEALGVTQVSLTFMCAGTPFALAFALRFPDRVTGSMLGISSWAPPSECSDARGVYQVATALPKWLVRNVTALGSGVGGLVMKSMPDCSVMKGFKSSLTPLEQQLFADKSPDTDMFMQQFHWVQEERGGESQDIEVLLAEHMALESTDLEKVTGQITLLHGEQDTTVPIGAAHWLRNQLSSASVDMQPIRQATHEGMIFMLHPMECEALEKLKM